MRDNENKKALSAFVPDGYCLLKVEKSRCTFKKKVQLPEIGVNEELDRTVLSSGQKAMMSPEIINWFRNPIDNADLILNRYGIPIIGKNLFLVPEKALNEIVIPAIRKLRSEFNFRKIMLIGNYDGYVEDWANACDSNPNLPSKFGDIIRNQHFPSEYIDEQLRFEFSIEVDVEKEIASSFLESISLDAEDYLSKMMKTASENKKYPTLNKKQFDKLVEFKERLSHLVFVDPKAQYVIDLIDDWFSNYEHLALNDKGNRQNVTDKSAVTSFIQLLSYIGDSEKLATLAQISVDTHMTKTITLQDMQQALIESEVL